MNTQAVFQQIYDLDGIDIQESAQGENYERIDFHHKSGTVDGHGYYEYHNGELNFLIVYQIEDQIFDIEHVRENGEDLVTFQNIEPYVGSAYIKNGVINKIIISEHPSKKPKQWVLSAKEGQRFLTLDD